jgi:hypothetical protein
MADVISRGHLWFNLRRLLEHAATVVVGLILMSVGLARGVTVIMLPVGVVVGLIGVACVVGGVFARIDER